MSLDSAIDLAQQITPRLLPLLPYLLQGAQKIKAAIHSTLASDGQEVLETAEKIWEKLEPLIDRQPVSKAALEKAAEQPTDPQGREALTQAIAATLDNEILRRSVADLLDQSRKKGLAIESFIKVGDIYSTVYGVRMVNARKTRAEKVRVHIEGGDVKKGGTIVGVWVEENSSPSKQAPKSHRQTTGRRKKADERE